jgi:polyphosphate kinase
LKFLTIVSSNLDEFFEIRVAGLQQQAEAHPGRTGPDGLNAQQTLEAIADRVRHMVKEQYRSYREKVVPELSAAGIDLLTVDDLSPKGRAWVQNYFRCEVFPVLTPLAIDPAHPFPQLLNKSLNLAVVLAIPDTPGQLDGLRPDEAHEDTRFGVVQVPRVLPRLVALPPEACPSGRRVYVFLSSIISEYIGDLFPGLEVHGCYAFRVTRNSELYLDEDEADNLLEEMEARLQNRRRGDAVRLEVQKGCDPAVVEMLLNTFELEPIDLFEVDGPVNLPRLMTVYSNEKRPDLKDAPFTTAKPRALRNIESADEFFAALRHEDILLHHPYDSFSSVTDFVSRAAEDPHTLAIKQTLYRTSGDSPIVKALVRAAENGKQVTALVELKARFDEENNIRWARRMEEAGVHVLYGLVGLKTHCKMALVVRREGEFIRRYVHLGTGNYNQVTARLYTDVGLLTARSEIGEDAAKIFNLLTGMSQFPGLEKLRMAPFGLHDEFRALVEREAAHARKHKGKTSTHKANAHKTSAPARIIAQMNSLVDPDMIKALYRASQAGVQIDLIVRGICCLRPGVPGVSDNICVRSIIDRFLEHPRIYYFANNGQEEIYCGSADWMPRNFFRRIEVVFPVEDERLKTRLRDEILAAALHDNVKARLIQPDGTHVRVKRAPHEPALRAQVWLLERARRGDANAPDLLGSRPAAPPVGPSQGDGEAGTVRTLPGIFEMSPRTAPHIIPPISTDGRAGTMGDPVLQSAALEWEATERRDQELQREDSERLATTVVSDEDTEQPVIQLPETLENGTTVDASAATSLKSTSKPVARRARQKTSTRKPGTRKPNSRKTSRRGDAS